MRLKILSFLGICLICFSCSYKQQHALFEEKRTPLPDSITQPTAPYVYRIRPFDKLQIRNLQNPRAFANDASNSSAGTGVQSEVFEVGEDGKLGLPVLGYVQVGGLTKNDAKNKIEHLYADSSLNNPIIELKVLNLHVTVFGEVKNPGNYPLEKEKTTLIDVLGQAGGLANSSDEKSIKIFHRDSPKPSYVNLGDSRILVDPRIVLQDGDVVFIAQNKRAIRDEKLQNLSTVIQPSLLVLNTALIIYTLFRK